MIDVDPSHQRQGIGAGLTQLALDWMKDAGMSTAMVKTGGDPGHAQPVIPMKRWALNYSQLPDTSRSF